MEWIQLPDDFKELLRFFHARHVEYLIVGGYAVSFYGYPRTTADIDIWMRPSLENAQRVVAALRDHGFGPETISTEFFSRPDQLVRIGVEPLRVEILTSISGVEFDDCYGRRSMHMVDSIPIALIGRADLLANKTASGRAKPQRSGKPSKAAIENNRFTRLIYT